MSGIPAGAGQLLGKRLGKFEIVALLALGGTAEIYLARIGGAAGFEKYVVVKCLHDHLADDAEFVKMFLDEARLAAHLDHSNIVQTMELGNHEGRYYMVMEFLAGLSLAMIIRRAGERMPDARIPVPLVLNILAQSCAGLHYAHEKAMNGRALNIVHRDISPQNLVISFEGVVKIVDFGIAKAEMRETRTRSGTIKGKFAYMSPEQCVANNVDRRTDVFALGVIAHELLTGRRLFKRPSPYETYQSVIECDVKPPSMLEPGGGDPALDDVIMRALTKDKADRYPNAEAFGDALLGYLHYRGIGSGPGDVSRFFEGHFGQELDEHSARMRELISGRDVAVEGGINWGLDDEYAQRSGHSRESPVAYVYDELSGGSRVEDDDEMPAERTRIETNPLERVNELERMVARNPPRSGKSSTPPGTTVPAQFAGLPSGRFPDLANLPTQIAPEGDRPISGPPPTTAFVSHAASEASAAAAELASGSAQAGVPAAASGFAHAPTSPAPSSVPASSPGFANAPTTPAPPKAPAGSIFAKPSTKAPAPSPPRPDASAFSNVPTTLSPPSFPDLVHTQPNGEGQRPVPHSSASEMPTMPPTAMAIGYPVMNAELSEQIATGASVFPSDSRPPPFHADPRGQAVPGSGPHAGLPGHPVPPVARSGPRILESGGQMPLDGMADPQRAANLMSPVGEHYPGQVDWSAAAAVPARAVPPWLLAILFIAAIGVALAFTIVIAKLVS